MKLAYYPGCCHHTSAMEYDVSTRVVSGALGLELIEIPDWNCCGSSAAHNRSHLLSLALPARNLAIAEDMGLDLTAPCAACYQRLALASRKLADDPALLEKVNQVTGRSYRATNKVKSIVEVYASLDPDYIRGFVKKPLSGLKIAAYYGCFLVRPPSPVTIDDPENPLMMEKIMQTAGAVTVDWPHKTECCGASHSISNEEIVNMLVTGILRAAADSGANCLVTACPLCHFNLDLRQRKLNKNHGAEFNLPVFYFTQLLGVALGLEYKELSLHTHFTDTKPVLQLVG